jgi:hypothetical protein
MKLEDFNKLMIRLWIKTGKGAKAFVPYIRAAGRIRTAEYIALELWKQNLPEDYDTECLRKRINHLHTSGEWDFE